MSTYKVGNSPIDEPLMMSRTFAGSKSIAIAGYGIYSSLSGLPGVAEAATAILDGAKGGKSAAEIIADVPLVAKAFAA